MPWIQGLYLGMVVDEVREDVDCGQQLQVVVATEEVDTGEHSLKSHIPSSLSHCWERGENQLTLQGGGENQLTLQGQKALAYYWGR